MTQKEMRKPRNIAENWLVMSHSYLTSEIKCTFINLIHRLPMRIIGVLTVS